MSNPEYDKLKKVWYKKLKDSGFDDKERSTGLLKDWDARFARKESVLSWRAKAAYYQMAENFLNDYTFASNRERIVWEYHANGMSGREISKTLKRVRIKIGRMAVWHMIKRLRAAMKQMYMVEHE